MFKQMVSIPVQRAGEFGFIRVHWRPFAVKKQNEIALAEPLNGLEKKMENH
jgi:hypothetical protein